MGANRQGLRDAFDGAMQRLADVTDMSQDQIPNSQCTSAFDVTVHMANIGLTTFGAFSCKQNPLPPQVCDFGRIELNPDAMTFCQNLNGCGESDGIEEAGEYDLAREKTSCHEVGHSVGLDHHTLTSSFYVDFPNDCLVQGWLEAHRQDAGWRRYNAHHINHVDNWLANH